jgi:hypothetical protein
MSDSQSQSATAPRRDPFPLGQIYDLITGDEDARVCKEIPETACRHQPRNFFAYLVSNVFTKVADELTSARLILPWLLGVLGAPAAFTGFLVPIREAGVLLPQLLVAAYIRRLPLRRGAWFLGTALCAAAVLLMLLPVTQLSGPAAGWAVLGLVTLFSLAKGICSVSAKDVLGKTVSKTRRGTLMGYSAGVAGAVTLAIGVYVEWYAERDSGVFVGFLLAAGLLYLASIAVFAFIVEEAGATEGGGNALTVALQSLAILRSDPAFRRFVIARALLLSVALVLPYYALLAQRHSGRVAGLGLMIIAAGLAVSLSSPLWGRLGDRSSRLVMAVAGAAAGVTGIATGALAAAGAGFMDSVWTWGVLFFFIAAFHNGVRLGRKTYLVDLATRDTRATYVAVSNTVIGAAMIAGGAFGVIADIVNPAMVIGLLGLLALLSSAYILRLPEVSG